MLIANSSDGKLINLAESWEKPILERMRDSHSFHCPACKEILQIKLGSKRIWHFSHMKDSACCVETEPETTYHLLGKRHLYKWLSQLRYEAELEKYFPVFKQRPDLYLPKLSTAVEFQCSTIPLHLIRDRTHSFQRNGINPIWILGAKRLSPSKKGFYRIDELALQSLCFDDDRNSSPYLIYFCPLTSSFTLLHSIIPFSKQTVLATHQIIPLKYANFPIIPKELTPDEKSKRLSEWIEKMITTRLFLHVNKDVSVMMMKRHLWKRNIPVSLFPVEAGIPSNHLIWFQSPSYVWQTCLLIEILLPLQVGESIQFRQIYHKFFSTIKYYKIQTHSTLPGTESHISYALMDYLQWLCKFGVLKRNGNHFTKIKEITFAKSITEIRDRMKRLFNQ